MIAYLSTTCILSAVPVDLHVRIHAVRTPADGDAEGWNPIVEI